jgi:5-methyltetrahydrofolate--homocysteine methyltransferase
MKESMALLEPLLVAAGIKPVATAVIGTVAGDLHDIGKNLVAMMWKGANFNVIDLGTNVAAEKFVEAAKEHNATIVGLSALLTTTMPAIKTTVDALKGSGMDVAKIVIGGAPVTQDYADEIGADGYAPDAASAVEVARTLMA